MNKDQSVLAKYGSGPPANRDWIIRQCIVNIANGMVSTDRYGNTIAPLTNGVRFLVRDKDDNILFDLSDGESILTNEEFIETCSVQAEHNDWGGSGNENLMIEMDFTKMFGASNPTGTPGLHLIGHRGDRVSMEMGPDDFTGLTSHRATIQGIEDSEGESARNKG